MDCRSGEWVEWKTGWVTGCKKSSVCRVQLAADDWLILGLYCLVFWWATWMMRQSAFSASFWEATNYTEWLDMLENRDALWRNPGKLDNWVDRILKGKCKSSRWGWVMLCVSADCLESTFAKKHLIVLVDNRLNMSSRVLWQKETNCMWSCESQSVAAGIVWKSKSFLCYAAQLLPAA